MWVWLAEWAWCGRVTLDEEEEVEDAEEEEAEDEEGLTFLLIFILMPLPLRPRSEVIARGAWP